MVTPAKRFQGWVETLSEAWKDRLRGWMASWLAFGLELILDVIGRGLGKRLDTIIDVFGEKYDIPTDILAEVKEAWKGEGEWQAMLGGTAGGTAVGSLIGSTIGPWLKLLEYAGLGLATPYRVDPLSWITAFRRKYEDFSLIEPDLKDQGWNEDRIEALKFITMFMPTATDIVSWYAREVYEKDMIDRYGLDSELPTYEETDFPKIGVDSTQARNFWMAHWEHASYMQIREMLRRGVLSLDKEMPTPPTTEEGWAARDAEGIKAAFDWYRLVEIPPFWRARLTEMMFEVPTRVDVRRFWDMRTIDEERLRSIYHAQGYHGKDLDDYILWTKVYVAFPDLMARWTRGWISLEDVRAELTDLGMPADRVEEMIQTKIKAVQPEREAAERDLTKTDIYKGVKQGRITRGEAIELLMDLGFDEDEADYLLAINIPMDEEDVVVKERELSKADILKGLKTEVITRVEAMGKLLDLRYSSTDAEFLLKIYDAQVKPPVEPREREASKADIVAAVKKALITPEEAYLMLLDIDFTPEASEFILEVRAEVSPFSPINYTEFKELTHKYRVAAGMEARAMPEELKKAAQELLRLTGEVEALEESIKEEKAGLIEGEVLPAKTTARLTKLEVARNRAISELERVKSEYDRLVAEWSHGLP